MKRVFEIDGKDFEDLSGFFDVFSQNIIPNSNWGRNLDAFDEVLEGEFGTPESGFILKWKNSELSRVRLGFAETVKWLKEKLSRCHPLNRDHIIQQIADAEANKGSTIFDTLVEIIKDHGVGGNTANDGVELQLC